MYSTAAETATSYTHTHHQLRVTLHVLHCGGDGRQLHSHTPPAAGYSACTPLRRRRPPVTLTHTTSCGLICTYSTEAETAASYTHTPPAAGYSACTPLRRRRPPVTLTHTTSCGLLCTYSTAAETAASYTHTHHRLRVTLHVLHCGGGGRQLHSHTPPAAGYSARTPLRRRRPPVTLTHTTSCGLICTYSTEAETAASYTHTHHQLRVTLHVLYCGGDGHQLHSHTTSCGLICTYSTAAETAASYTHTHHQLRATLHVLHCGGDGRQLHSHTPPAAG